MNSVRYRIRLEGLASPSGTISVTALRELLDGIVHSSERTLRLLIEGVSTKKGRLPAWVDRSLQFTVSGISSGSTVIELEAPELRETASEQVAQQNLWYTLPDPSDTALSLLSKSISDAATGKAESERYDRGLLESFLGFQKLIGKHADAITVECPSRPAERFRVAEPELEKMVKLKAETPLPKAVVVSGSFNMIEHSGRRFRLDLEAGQKIQGHVDASQISDDEMRRLWGKDVTIRGTAEFTPSGKARHIEAQVLKPFEEGEEIFRELPEALPQQLFMESLIPAPKQKAPFLDIWDRWPGDEPIEVLLSTLHEISRES